MYYSMKNIGDDTAEKLKKLSGVTEKWHCISDTASYLGVSGLQISPEYQHEYGLSLTEIPGFIRDSFRLTYHNGIHYHLHKPEDNSAFHTMLENSLNVAIKAGMEDVSIHPPLLANIAFDQGLKVLDTQNFREETRSMLPDRLEFWIPRFKQHGITLSMESHVTSSYFVFQDMPDYRDFMSSMPEIGALVDVSHNFFDGYTVPDILTELQNVRITGFHISDAIQGVALKDGTHLPIGRGHLFFRPLSDIMETQDIYAAFEIRGRSQDIRDGISYLQQIW